MGGVGVWELIIILILVFIIFGSRRIPELGRGLGQGLAHFRRALHHTGGRADSAPDSGPGRPPESPDE